MMYGQEGGYGSVPKKKKTGLVVGIIVFLLLFVGGLFLVYKIFFAKNSIQFLLDKTFDSLELSLANDLTDSLKADFSVNMEFSSKDDEANQLFSIFNKLDLTGSYGIDFDKNIVSMDLKSNYDDKDLIDMNFYTEYGRGYIYLDGLYNKYIDMPIDGYSELFERDTVDSKNIIIGVRKAIDNSLKDEYYTVEKVIKNKEKVTKTTLDLTNDNYRNFNDEFVSSLLNNKVFLESYGNVTGKDIEEVKIDINKILESDSEYNGEKYILYTKGFNFIEAELISEEFKFVVKNDKNIYKYECYTEDELQFSGDVDFKMKENTCKISFSFYDVKEDVGVNIELDETTIKNAKIESVDVSNSVSIEKLNNVDMLVIYGNLMKNEGVKKIMQEVTKIMGDNILGLPMIMS